LSRDFLNNIFREWTLVSITRHRSVLLTRDWIVAEHFRYYNLQKPLRDRATAEHWHLKLTLSLQNYMLARF
jgi:hypothetical protein